MSSIFEFFNLSIFPIQPLTVLEMKLPGNNFSIMILKGAIDILGSATATAHGSNVKENIAPLMGGFCLGFTNLKFNTTEGNPIMAYNNSIMTITPSGSLLLLCVNDHHQTITDEISNTIINRDLF